MSVHPEQSTPNLIFIKSAAKCGRRGVHLSEQLLVISWNQPTASWSVSHLKVYGLPPAYTHTTHHRYQCQNCCPPKKGRCCNALMLPGHQQGRPCSTLKWMVRPAASRMGLDSASEMTPMGKKAALLRRMYSLWGSSICIGRLQLSATSASLQCIANDHTWRSLPLLPLMYTSKS